MLKGLKKKESLKLTGPFISLEELAQHNTEDDCWILVENSVYNITNYAEYHPGGKDLILEGAGINATDLFCKPIFYLFLANLIKIKIIRMWNTQLY
jgi:cytochrome b involved in lipid metabolism